jgi:hypothetical protein
MVAMESWATFVYREFLAAVKTQAALQAQQEAYFFVR